MAPRIASLMLSAWIGVSAYALVRPPTQAAVFASMGLCCAAAELVAFVFGPGRFINTANGAALLLVAVIFPAPAATTAEVDVIVAGVFLLLSLVRTRPPRAAAPPPPLRSSGTG